MRRQRQQQQSGRKPTARSEEPRDRAHPKTARELQVAVGTDNVLAAWINQGEVVDASEAEMYRMVRRGGRRSGAFGVLGWRAAARAQQFERVLKYERSRGGGGGVRPAVRCGGGRRR